MQRIGLTGGIAAGKSVAARRFAELGARVIDADELSRLVVQPGTSGYDDVVAAFGDVVVGPDGALDRGVLGRLVFADEGARHRLESIVHLDPELILDTTRAITMHLMGEVVALLAFVAIADYLFQYQQWYERQKMSLQEIKEEHKQSEGDPHIKGRIRQLRVARMKKRMMSAVPKASVIITNPTHFAIALQYNPQEMAAPLCLAKGIDEVALRIRALAEENKIVVVENPPLARVIYDTVELDQPIPAEHYKAVAEIISYVFRLKGKLR